MAKTIKNVPLKFLQLCTVKSEKAQDLTRDEICALMGWCDCQEDALWDSMSLQEILNVYRVSAEWDTWEGWASEDVKAAHKAWNRAVIWPGNKMQPLAA